MAPITTTTEVDRAPAEVFDYVTDPTRFVEWQRNVVGGHMDTGGPTAVGTKCLTTRKIGFAERAVTAEVTHIDPPRAWGVHGIDGPIRAIVNVTVDPLDDGRRSRLTIEVDFEGHGIGKLLVPLAVRRQARNEMPVNLRTLKQRLEARAKPTSAPG
ncbi:MAG: SRPBCC family protein [Pseudonocardiaceae bacterium]